MSHLIIVALVLAALVLIAMIVLAGWTSSTVRKSIRRGLVYRLYRKSNVLPIIYWKVHGLLWTARTCIVGFIFDRYYGLETSAPLGRYNLGFSIETAPHVSSYNACDVGQVKHIIRKLNIDQKRFCFIDVGSGKGRALFIADQFGFARIIGIEFSPPLHRVAERNLQIYLSRTRRDSKIELYNMDALEFELPTKPTVVCMFSPFDKLFMVPFVEKLDRSLALNPRQLEVIYVRPIEEAALARSRSLRKVGEGFAGGEPFVHYSGPETWVEVE
jgi:hypothetical protein